MLLPKLQEGPARENANGVPFPSPRNAALCRAAGVVGAPQPIEYPIELVEELDLLRRELQARALASYQPRIGVSKRELIRSCRAGQHPELLLRRRGKPTKRNHELFDHC